MLIPSSIKQLHITRKSSPWQPLYDDLAWPSELSRPEDLLHIALAGDETAEEDEREWKEAESKELKIWWWKAKH